MNKKKVFLVDGYSFLFRAYYASPNLTSPSGMPIGGVYGFIQMMFRLIEGRNIKYICVILDKDSSKNTVRHKIFEQYKAHRPTLPQELIAQFKIMREALEAFGIKYVEQSGVEADDIIASYTRLAEKSDFSVEIISSDKDLFQLIDEKRQISMYDPVKDLEITSAIVKEKLGIFPAQLCDYLGLLGDSADNVPGVRGIGPKTASSLLQKYHSISQIYELIDEVKPERIQSLLRGSRDIAFLSKKLTTLIEDLPLFYKFEEFMWSGLLENSNNIQHFFNKYSLKTLAARYLNKIVGQQISHVHDNKNMIIEQENVKRTYCSNSANLISDSAWEQIYEQIRYNGTLYVHIELMKDNTQIESVSILCQDLLLSLQDWNNISQDTATIENIKKILESDTIQKVVFDLKTILHALKRYEITINFVDDIKLLAYSTGSGKYNQKYDLVNIKNEYLNDWSENVGCIPMVAEDQKDLQTLILYKKLFHPILSKLNNQQQLSLYYKIDKPLSRVLFSMERLGVLIDSVLLQNIQKDYIKKIAKLEREIQDIAGIEFNLHSPRQMSKVLFEHLKLPISADNKKLKSEDQYSTNNEILEELSAKGFGIADQILEWRQYIKISNTFINGLLTSINPETKRVHTNFNATLTNSGRLSSHAPNLQNIPIRTQEGKKIREAFIAAPGCKLISADYSQIEIRILAHIANITTLLDVFKRGQDIHAITAHQVFNIPLDKVDETWRRRAKTINFGIIYGISPFGLSKSLQIPVNVAGQYIKQYLAQYSGIEKYMFDSIEEARKNGYIKTLFGRRCFTPNIQSKNKFLRKFNERIAINAPIQGTAADIIRKAMVTLPQELINYITLQIHDELLFEIPEQRVLHAIDIIRHTMESVINLATPIPVEMKIGNSLGEMEVIQRKR